LGPLIESVDAIYLIFLHPFLKIKNFQFTVHCIA